MSNLHPMYTIRVAAPADPNAYDCSTALTAAAASDQSGPEGGRSERLAILQRLLAAGARVNGLRRSALFAAAGLLRPEAVRLLLAHGADPNLTDQYRDPPLLNSLTAHGDEATHVEILSLLIGSGADVNARTKRHDWTALRLAAARGSAGMVGLLLARGADPHVTDDAGMSPLMLVAQLSSRAGATEVVLRLANADADVNALDWVGQTAARIAFAKGNPEMLVLLRALGRRMPRRTSRGPGSTRPRCWRAPWPRVDWLPCACSLTGARMPTPSMPEDGRCSSTRRTAGMPRSSRRCLGVGRS